MRLRNIPGSRDVIAENEYVVHDERSVRGKWNLVFGNDNPVRIEIGMGKGDFIINNALKYPNINFIGIEKYDSVIVRAIQKSNELELNNLKILRMDALNLNNVFDKEIDTIYLNFSDPWPKARHTKRRLTSLLFLKIYDDIFKSDKRIIMKTDNIDLFNYSLETLTSYGYEIIYQTNNLNCLDDDNIMTEYENKFYHKGVKINKLIAIKKVS